MRITKEERERLKRILHVNYATYGEIADETGVHPQTVGNLLRHGTASDETGQKIIEAIESKQKQVA